MFANKISLRSDESSLVTLTQKICVFQRFELDLVVKIEQIAKSDKVAHAASDVLKF